LSRVLVTIDGVLDWMIGFIDTYTFTQFGTTGNYSAIAILHTFQLTVPHALGFSVFTGRILASDLSQSHCHFNSHMLYSWHSLIPFLPLPDAANSEPSTQFPSDYCSVLLLLLVEVEVTLRLAVYRQSVCLGVEPLETDDQNFFSQLNHCDISPYVTSSLTRRWVCLLLICLAFRQVYISHI
jgi:hypothetical protein